MTFASCRCRWKWDGRAPILRTRPLADRHPFRHLEPAENHVTGSGSERSAIQIPARSTRRNRPKKTKTSPGPTPWFSRCFSAAPSARISDASPQPCKHQRTSPGLVSTMGGRLRARSFTSSPPTHVGSRQCPGRHWRYRVRIGNEIMCRPGRSGLGFPPAGRIESFAAENELHRLPQPEPFQIHRLSANRGAVRSRRKFAVC